MAAKGTDAEKQGDQQEKQDKKVKLVKMKRDKEVYPNGPHEADVHPDEVGNFQAGGWTVAE